MVLILIGNRALTPPQSFNLSFRVLVDLDGISIIKFIRSVFHARLLDEHYQLVTQRLKWTNCLSTEVEVVGQHPTVSLGKHLDPYSRLLLV